MPLLSNFDALKAASQRRVQKVEIPRDGDEPFVGYVQEITVGERNWCFEGKEVDGVVPFKDRLYPRLLCRALVDEHGNRVLTDEQSADLADLKPEIYDPLVEAAARLNKLYVGAIEDAAKNSESSPSDSSSSS